MSGKLVLVIDDSQHIVKHLTERLLPLLNYQSIFAYDGRSGFELIRDQQPDVVLLDLNLPAMTGIDVLKRLAQEAITIPVILMTGYGSERSAIEAFRLGASDYLMKPFTTEELSGVLERALQKQAQQPTSMETTEPLLRRNAEMDYRLRETTELLRVTKGIMALRSTEEVTENILNGAVTLTGAEECTIWLWDSHSDLLRAHTKALAHYGEIPSLTVPAQDLFLAPVFQNRQIIRTSSFSGPGIQLKPGYTIRAILMVPLIINDKCIGVLGSINRLAPTPFSEQHQIILSELADFTAIALENVQALENKRALPRTEDARAIIQLTRAISSSLNLDEVLRIAIKRIHSSWNIQATSLWLLNEPRQTLRVLANVGTPSDILIHIEVPIGQGLVGHSVKTGKWIYTNNVDKHPLHYREVDKQTGFSTHSLLCVPLLFRNKVIGALELLNKQDGDFDSNDVERALSIATTVAIALANALLYKQAESRQQQLEAALEHNGNSIIITDRDARVVLLNRQARQRLNLPEQAIGKLVSEVFKPSELASFLEHPLSEGEVRHTEIELPDKSVWLCTIAPIPTYGRILVLQDITCLKQINESKSDFVSTVSHDLRAPLNSIIEYGRLLESSENLDEDDRLYAEQIVESSGRMLQLVNDLLDLARISTGIGRTRQTCDMVRIVKEVVADLQGHASSKEIFLNLEAQNKVSPVFGDPLQLRQAVSNLVDNAIKYSPAQSQVAIQILSSGYDVLVRVQDHGEGIPTVDLPFIFDRFYRSKTHSQVEGTGLGLALVRSIAETHGGQAWVESEMNQGSIFVLQLPALRPRATDSLKPVHS